MFQCFFEILVVISIYFLRCFLTFEFYSKNITHNNIIYDPLNCSVPHSVVFNCDLIAFEVDCEVKLYKIVDLLHHYH